LNLFTQRYVLDWQRPKKTFGLNGDNCELLTHCTLIGLLKGVANNKGISSVMLSRDQRNKWELEFHNACFGKILDPEAVRAALEGIKAKYDNQDEFQVGKMLEEQELSTYSVKERSSAAPALFRFREGFTLERLEHEIRATQTEYPLLFKFFTEDIKARGAHELVTSLQFLRLMTTYYNKRVTPHRAATQLVVGDALETVGNGKALWQRAWEGYRTAWNLEAHMDQPIECGVEVPKVAMQLSTSITLCLPTDVDQGLLPKALASTLVDFHNEFRKLAQTHLDARGGRAPEPPRVESSMLSESNVIFHRERSYEAALNKLLRFVMRHCLIVSLKNGKLSFDLAAAEKWLVDTYFASCPLVQLDLQYMKYVDDNAVSNALQRLRLSDNVEAEPLPQEMVAEIQRRVPGPSEAQPMIEELEQALVIMIDAIVGAEVTGDSKLWSVLMLKSDVFAGVKLRHVDSLYNLLKSKVVTDDFPTVNSLYKDPLDEAAKEQLAEACEDIEDLEALVEAMNELMTGMLRGKAVSRAASITQTMMAMYDELEDDCLAVFGSKLTMSNFCAAYSVLDRVMTFQE